MFTHLCSHWVALAVHSLLSKAQINQGKFVGTNKARLWVWSKEHNIRRSLSFIVIFTVQSTRPRPRVANNVVETIYILHDHFMNI